VRGHCTATSCRTLAHAIRAPTLAPPGRPTHGSGSEGGWTPLQQAVAKKQQKVLEGLAQRGKVWKGWIHRPDSFPLYTPTRRLGGVMCGVWCPHPPTHATQTLARARQPDGVGQTNPVGQKVKRSMGAAHKPHRSRWFGNHHSNCIDTDDAHCATTGLQRGEPPLHHFVCQKPHYSMTYQRRVATYLLAEPHYHRIS
jgi:hypothetical protein